MNITPPPRPYALLLPKIFRPLLPKIFVPLLPKIFLIVPIIYNQQFVFKRLPVPKVTYLVELLCLGKMDLRCSRVLFYCDQIRGYHQIRELHKVISKHIALSRPSATVCPNIKTFYHPPPSSRPSNNRLQQLKTNCQIILSKPNILSTTVAQRLFYYSF